MGVAFGSIRSDYPGDPSNHRAVHWREGTVGSNPRDGIPIDVLEERSDGNQTPVTTIGTLPFHPRNASRTCCVARMYHADRQILRLADALEGLDGNERAPRQPSDEKNRNASHQGVELPVVPMPRHGKHGEEDSLESLWKRLQVKPTATFQRRFEMGATIGHGSFGKVKKATDRRTGEIVAVKLFTTRPGYESQFRQFLQECDILKVLDHPNIARFDGVYAVQDDTFALVMELATGGELFERIQAKGSFTEAEAATIIRQVLEALQHMHSRNIAHRDLKPENVLFEDTGTDGRVKLIDFGFAKRSSPSQSTTKPLRPGNGTNTPSFASKGDKLLSTRLGSPNYVAPEILYPHQGYGVEVDIWSLGVILYIMLCGYFPFYHDNERELYNQIRSGKFAMPDEDWGHVSSAAKDFVCSMLTPDPRLRASAGECLKHPWIAKPGVASKRPFPQASMDRLNIYLEDAAAPHYEKLLDIVRGDAVCERKRTGGNSPVISAVQESSFDVETPGNHCDTVSDSSSAGNNMHSQQQTKMACCVIQ